MTNLYFSQYPTAAKAPSPSKYREEFILLQGKTANEVIRELTEKSQILKDKSGNEVIVKGSDARYLYLVAHSITCPITFEQVFSRERYRQNEIMRNLHNYNTIREVLLNTYLPPICIKIDYLCNFLNELEENKKLYPDRKYEKSLEYNKVKLAKFQEMQSSIADLLDKIKVANGEYDPDLIKEIKANPIWSFREGISGKKALVIIEEDREF